ncbi:MAG: hypothetical protein M0R06_03050 [Sphaerochaeta sp.]|jgi:membrane protein implicated in regulation of membrane protease activity|nr:hypothetical protein [Sphaerochaeta sp.]
MKVTSSGMLIICVLVLAAGFFWATFFPSAPFGVLAPSVVALATAYFTKRVVQKSDKFGGSEYSKTQRGCPNE